MPYPSRGVKLISTKYQYYCVVLANLAELKSLGQGPIVEFWYNNGNHSVGRRDSQLSTHWQEKKEMQIKQPTISLPSSRSTVDVSPDEDPP